MWTEEEFVDAVRANTTIAGVLRSLNQTARGGSRYRRVRTEARRLGLDTSHWVDGRGGQTRGVAYTLDDILVRDSPYLGSSSNLKKKILNAGLLLYECSDCRTDEWRGKPLTLHLDHINGVNDDHRIENLRFLCPNCHSQTPTYAGRNASKHRSSLPPSSRKVRLCLECEKEVVPKRSLRCRPCYLKSENLNRPTKIDWPDQNELERLVWEFPRTTLSNRWGVSDSAIAKRCRKLGIRMPPRGYWSGKGT